MLHNIVVHLQSSPQRMARFLVLSHNRKPARDNKTRWNSWAKMLKVATSSPVCDAIKAYFDHYSGDEVALDQLTSDDWQTLQQIHAFLDELSQTTLALEPNSSTLENVLPAMDYILERFEAGRSEYKNNEIIAPMFNSGWAKLDKYYGLTEESPAYAAALVLNPSFKWVYVRKNWQSGWVKTAEKMVQDLWDKQYKPQGVSIPAVSTTQSTTNSFKLWKMRQQSTPNHDDEYARYCATEIVGVTDARQWWMEKTQQDNYPSLSKMALDILSIPAMSAEPERLFSSAKLTLSETRNRLGIELIQAFECLKSWNKLQDWNSGNFLAEEVLAQD